MVSFSGRLQREASWRWLRLLAPAVLMALSGCGKGCSTERGAKCVTSKDCDAPLACQGNRCLWPGACTIEKYAGRVDPANLEERMTQSYDEKGRALEFAFSRDDFTFKKVCSYDDAARKGICVGHTNGSVSHTEVHLFDADERVIEVREYTGIITSPSALRGRTVHQWSSSGCPTIPTRVHYRAKAPAKAVGRLVPQCDGEGRIVARRTYGDMWGGGGDDAADLTTLVEEVLTEYDESGRVARETRKSAARGAKPDQKGVGETPDEITERIQDEYGQYLEIRTMEVSDDESMKRKPKSWVTRLGYGCWEGGAADKAVDKSARNEAMLTVAQPLIERLAGRWNFVGDDADKMVFLLAKGKMGIVEKGEYSEVAARVVAATKTSLTISVSPPPGSKESPMRFVIGFVDEKSIVMSIPSRPDRKGRMYVR